MWKAGGYVRKNKYQTAAMQISAMIRLVISTNSMDGPRSAWRASVGVSMMMPCYLRTIDEDQNFAATDLNVPECGWFLHEHRIMRI
jgi:hypothetical protein